MIHPRFSSRALIAVLLSLGIAGCVPDATVKNTSADAGSNAQAANASSVQTTPTDVPATSAVGSTRAMLSAGQGEACAQPDVRDTIINEIKPRRQFPSDWSPDEIASIQIPVSYAFDTMAFTGVDRETSSIACQANVTITQQGSEGRVFSIRYIIRPSLDADGSIVINASVDEATAYAKDLGVDHIAELQMTMRKVNSANRVPSPTVPPAAEGNTD